MDAKKGPGAQGKGVETADVQAWRQSDRLRTPEKPIDRGAD
jgi:hypothetical protein